MQQTLPIKVSVHRRQRGHRRSSTINGRLLLAAFLAATQASAQQGGTPSVPGAWDLSSYQLCGIRPLDGMGAQASGAAYNPVTGSWWVLGGHPDDALFELSAWPELHLIRTLRIRGIVKDPEAIAWLSGNVLLVTDETDASVTYLDIDNVNSNSQPAVVTKKWLNGLKFEYNKCLEGVAIDHRPGTVEGMSVLVAQEEKPRRVIQLNTQSGVWKVLFDLDAFEKRRKQNAWRPEQEAAAKTLKDLSDIWMSDAGRLFVLSQESCTVAELDMEGGLLQSMPVQLPWPEGLALSPDGRYMLVVSEARDPKQSSQAAMYAVAGSC